MSDMLERAAKAIADKWLEKVDDATVRIGPPVIARAALLAALDPEDEALVEEIARATYLVGRDWDTPYSFDTAPGYAQDAQRDIARTAIATVKHMAQGETGLSRDNAEEDNR